MVLYIHVKYISVQVENRVEFFYIIIRRKTADHSHLTILIVHINRKLKSSQNLFFMLRTNKSRPIRFS